MAQSGYTPIQLYRTSTAAATPSAGNLADGELAINTLDEKLYFKNSAGTVKLLASAAGATGDVVGPASATDGNLAAFDGTTGKLIKQASTVTTAQGGTGLTSFTSGGAVYATSTSALATGTLPVTAGGTGLATTTAYSIVFSGTTSTGAFQASAGPGTATYVLTSNGAGALPTWQAPAASGITTGKSIAMAMIFGF